MKASTLRDRTVEELRHSYENSRKELFELRLGKSKADSSEQPLRIRALRRDIARIKTVMREKEV